MDHGPNYSARSKPRGWSEDETAVVAHYLSRHPKRRVDDKAVRRYVRPALTTHGFSPTDLIAAIDGNALDAWHVERKKHELSYVLRDMEHISKFMALAEPQTPDTELVGINGDAASVYAALGVAV